MDVSEYGNDHVAIDGVTCESGSAKAIKVFIDGEVSWIPQSQIHDDSEVYKADTEGTLIITRWLAERKNFL